MDRYSAKFKTPNFELLSLFGHDFNEPKECITCDICCPGSCTACTRCHSCHITHAHGEKGTKYWDNKTPKN